MIFTEPVEFEEAVESLRFKQVARTKLSSVEIGNLSQALRNRAFFSARVTNGEFLGKAKGLIDDIVAGKSNRATARASLKEFLKSIRYKPDAPRDQTGLIADMMDLRSDRRLNLIIETQTNMARGYGRWKQGQTQEVLDFWPAQELFRAEDRKVPRNWIARWTEAGGQLYDGRMIARKDSPIWTDISRFGNPYPPFDFNSGMEIRDIDIDEATALGVIKENQRVRPQPEPMNRDLKASTSLRGRLLESLARTLGPDHKVNPRTGKVARR